MSNDENITEKRVLGVVLVGMFLWFALTLIIAIVSFPPVIIIVVPLLAYWLGKERHAAARPSLNEVQIAALTGSEDDGALYYYGSSDGSQHGPVRRSRLAELARSGKITPRTWVIRNGAAEWISYDCLTASEPATAVELTCVPAIERQAAAAFDFVSALASWQSLPDSAFTRHSRELLASAVTESEKELPRLELALHYVESGRDALAAPLFARMIEGGSGAAWLGSAWTEAALVASGDEARVVGIVGALERAEVALPGSDLTRRHAILVASRAANRFMTQGHDLLLQVHALLVQEERQRLHAAAAGIVGAVAGTSAYKAKTFDGKFLGYTAAFAAGSWALSTWRDASRSSKEAEEHYERAMELMATGSIFWRFAEAWLRAMPAGQRDELEAGIMPVRELLSILFRSELSSAGEAVRKIAVDLSKYSSSDELFMALDAATGTLRTFATALLLEAHPAVVMLSRYRNVLASRLPAGTALTSETKDSIWSQMAGVGVYVNEASHTSVVPAMTAAWSAHRPSGRGLAALVT